MILQMDSSVPQKSTITDWPIPQLDECLTKCFKDGCLCFCLFLDGLDEAEIETGLPQNSIIRFVQRVTSFSNVKCCVSSRPERKFEIAFGDGPQLQLEKLNPRDIRKYFDDNVGPLLINAGCHPHGDLLRDLRYEFVHKAGGVFLWACLSLKSLVSGIENEDSWTELCQRLEALPHELEELYEQMWKRQNQGNPSYQEDGGSFLDTCLAYSCCASRNRPHVFESDDQNPALLDLILTLPRNYDLRNQILKGNVTRELEQQCEKIRVRVRTRSAGLLTYYDAPHDLGKRRVRLVSSESFPALHSACSSQAVFVHRTAKDFLLKSKFGQSICSYPKLPVHSVLRRILHTELCRDSLDMPEPRPDALLSFLSKMPTVSAAVHLQDSMVHDVGKTFRNRVIRSRPHLRSKNWFLATLCASECKACRHCQLDFLGAMILGYANVLVEISLKLYKAGDLGSEYTTYLLYCWVSDPRRQRSGPCSSPQSLIEQVWHEASTSTKFLHQVLYRPRARRWLANSERSMCIRVCVSEWYLQAVRFLVARRMSSNQLRAKPSGLHDLFAVHFALREPCYLLGTYKFTSSSHKTLELESLSTTRTYFSDGFRSGFHMIKVVFECNVAFLLRATVKYARIERDGCEQDEVAEPTIRAVGFLQPFGVELPRTTSEPIRRRTWSLHGRRIGESGSDELCKILRSDQRPRCDDGKTLTWSLNEQDSADFISASHRAWDNGEVVSYRNFILGLGHVSEESPEVIHWPPPVRPSSTEASPPLDDDRTGDDGTSTKPQILETQTDPTTLFESPRTIEEIDLSFDFLEEDREEDGQSLWPRIRSS